MPARPASCSSSLNGLFLPSFHLRPNPLQLHALEDVGYGLFLRGVQGCFGGPLMSDRLRYLGYGPEIGLIVLVTPDD